MACDPSGFRLHRDLPALLLVVAAIGGAAFYRRYGVEPRFWAAACIAGQPPFGCLPRAAAVWLQGQDLWGWAALLLGVAAFVTRRFAVAIAALILGGAAVVNFNATLGMPGAALGLWTWLRLRPRVARERGAARAEAEPEPAPQRSRSAPRG